MIATAHQPTYLPWPGLIHKIYLADNICFLDDVKLSKQDYVTRTLIGTKNGAVLQSVPTLKFHHTQALLSEVKIDDRKNWRRKHLNTIYLNYKNSPFFNEIFDGINSIISDRTIESIVGLNIGLINFILQYLRISKKIFLASTIQLKSGKNERLIDFSLKTQSTSFIFGENGKVYADKAKFIQSNILVGFQKFNYPTYNSPYFSQGNLSILDLLMFCGEDSLAIILESNSSNFEDLEKFL